MNLPTYQRLTTYANETRVFTLGREALVSVARPDTCGKARMLVAVTRDGFRTDYPRAYWNGTVGWDSPELFSKRFRERAKRHIMAANL